MREALKRQDYVFLGLEVIVVIFSILVAFQTERWAEDGCERKEEQNYLLRLKEDMQIEIAHMDDAVGYARERIEAALLLEKIVSGPVLARDVQIQFDRQTAGILSSEELRSIEELTWQDLHYDISAQRGAEIAEQFRSKPLAIALIPSIVQHHVFNVRAIEQTRSSALAIIDQIEQLLAGFSG